jgi:hypothetical protein
MGKSRRWSVGSPHGREPAVLRRAPARRVGRARRVREVVRGSAGRAGRREVDAGPDPARRRRASTEIPGTCRAVRAVFACTDRRQPAGLGRRGGADRGIRGLRAVHAQDAGLTLWRPERRHGCRRRKLRANAQLVQEGFVKITE